MSTVYLTLPVCCRDGVSGKDYSSLPAEAKFANSLGILIITFGLVILGILSKDKWQRPKTDDESVQVRMQNMTDTHHQQRLFWYIQVQPV